MKTQDFFYKLPDELIAQHPIEPRDYSRMLVLNRKTGVIEHKHFYDIIDYLQKGDLLVINNTRVIPARLFGSLENSDKVVEVLLLKRIDYNHYEAICKPGKKLKIGTYVKFSDELQCVVESIGEQGIRIIKLIFDGILENVLDKVGNMPLPPYITEKLEDKERYQTVYSKVQGSAAAPTAGLHFTQELLDKISNKGVEIQKVLLHVGLSTFRPVKVDSIEEHKMHTEYYEVSEETASAINKAKAEGRRVICVGTTSVRTVESAADAKGHIVAGCGNTSIFIYPPYKFKIVDAIVTNFHLPESTLIMLVSAFCGIDTTINMYNIAVEEKYRFFSFGDATLLL